MKNGGLSSESSYEILTKKFMIQNVKKRRKILLHTVLTNGTSSDLLTAAVRLLAELTESSETGTFIVAKIAFYIRAYLFYF